MVDPVPQLEQLLVNQRAIMRAFIYLRTGIDPLAGALLGPVLADHEKPIAELQQRLTQTTALLQRVGVEP